MISLILAAIVSFGTTLFVTPHFIKYLTRKKYGQFIRQDGPERHFDKLGTPTMGGVVIIFAVILGFVTYSAYNYITINHPPSTSLLLVLFLFLSMGLVGFIDDYIQIVKKRSLGLTVKGKLALQLLFGSVFTVLAINFPNSNGLTPASTNISFLRDTSLNFEALGPVLGVIALIIWINFIILSWTNAINLTDGLDGLATGVSSMGFAAYVLICMWKSSKSCALAINQGITTTNISDITGEATTNELCYTVRDPWDLATFSAIVLVALVGFLWWNASPAKIFMGDTGSLALGGAFAGISILSRTEFLAVIIGGVMMMEILSDVIQIISYKSTKKRVFRMAPIHHHFEMGGWAEQNVVIRFWILAIMFAAFGIAIFYGEWVAYLKWDI